MDSVCLCIVQLQADEKETMNHVSTTTKTTLFLKVLEIYLNLLMLANVLVNNKWTAKINV